MLGESLETGFQYDGTGGGAGGGTLVNMHSRSLKTIYSSVPTMTEQVGFSWTRQSGGCKPV